MAVCCENPSSVVQEVPISHRAAWCLAALILVAAVVGCGRGHDDGHTPNSLDVTPSAGLTIAQATEENAGYVELVVEGAAADFRDAAVPPTLNR